MDPTLNASWSNLGTKGGGTVNGMQYCREQKLRLRGKLFPCLRGRTNFQRKPATYDIDVRQRLFMWALSVNVRRVHPLFKESFFGAIQKIENLRDGDGRKN